MSTIIHFQDSSPREESIAQLVDVLPICIQRAAEEVGVEGVKAFFNGFKQSQEEQRFAA